MAIFGTLSVSSTMAHHTRMLSKAVFLAERVLTEAKLTEITDYDTKPGQEGSFNWIIQVTRTPVDGLGAITVKVTWQEKGQAKHFSLRSLVRVRVIRG